MNELDDLTYTDEPLFSLSHFDSIHSMPFRLHSLACDGSVDCLECDGNNRNVESKWRFANQLELRASDIGEMKLRDHGPSLVRPHGLKDSLREPIKRRLIDPGNHKE
jgi:hypothetical protein